MKEKRKMQDVHFRTVEDMLDFLPDDQREIAEVLRSLVLETLPLATERLSYNVPYYYGHAAICFIWPGAVPWGKLTLEGVRLGFTKGYLIPDDIGFLDMGNRKQVGYRDLRSPLEIDTDIFRAYLELAAEIDATTAKPERKKSSSRR